ncbi:MULTISPECIES: ANTAR domain-containing protein [unclassified Rhodococcus (in: high G+C Gram-positive bacteria)]|uniref:ANTAR domain-containing protein n=1 Tax=unclassified Rhodococcus (in: high G+C Gram-positive bacteria) TaxID=192944 RepID=UPI0009286554|nr:ANTAR domain-containing protein [Rhodococcus sp. M8]OLL19014.1 ANTAR domain-containing protein [Rhodococcus sp. M8]QPG47705.1 ANTAR domain-containing protein [Rhodococcus sp. M8]
MTIEAHRDIPAVRRLTALDTAQALLRSARGRSYTEDQAFDELLDASMRFHVDIVDLCEALTDLATGPGTIQGLRRTVHGHRRAHTVAAELWGPLLDRRTASAEN